MKEFKELLKMMLEEIAECDCSEDEYEEHDEYEDCDECDEYDDCDEYDEYEEEHDDEEDYEDEEPQELEYRLPKTNEQPFVAYVLDPTIEEGYLIANPLVSQMTGEIVMADTLEELLDEWSWLITACEKVTGYKVIVVQPAISELKQMLEAGERYIPARMAKDRINNIIDQMSYADGDIEVIEKLSTLLQEQIELSKTLDEKDNFHC